MPSRPEQLSSGRRAAAGRYPGERPDGKHVEYRCSAGTDIAHSPDPEQLSPRYGGEPIQTSWGALKQVAGSRQSYTQLRRAKCSKAIRPQIRDLNKQTYTTASNPPIQERTPFRSAAPTRSACCGAAHPAGPAAGPSPAAATADRAAKLQLPQQGAGTSRSPGNARPAPIPRHL